MSDSLTTPLFFQTLRTILEIIYFISAPILVFLGVKGLRQIKIGSEQLRQTKVISNLQARRDAAKLAAQQCEIFSQIITNEFNTWMEYIESKNVPLFLKGAIEEKVTTQAGSKTASFKLINGKFIDYRQEICEAFPYGMPLANKLEAFAVYMVKGVADEAVTFAPCSDIFCKAVRSLLPLLLIEHDANGTFDNTLSLYLIWNERRNKLKILLEKNKLEEQLKQMTDIKVMPIGLS